DRDVAHGLQARRRGERRHVHEVRTGGKDGILVCDPAPQFLGAPGCVVLLVVLDFEALAQLRDDVVEGGAGDEDLGFHVFSGKLFLESAPGFSGHRPTAAATGRYPGTGTAGPARLAESP